MKIVFCASEATPFAKVGGLGDVVGSLPKALEKLGDEVIVCIPYYGCIAPEEYNLVETGITFTVNDEGRSYPIHILESKLPGSQVPVYFIGNHLLYGSTPEIYPQGKPEDEVLRFEVFCQAVLGLLAQLQWQPDVFQVHDWHTAPLARLLHRDYRDNLFFNQAGVVLTIHNMAYQGISGGRNRLEEGLLYSDALVAVSPTYAQEILTANAGAGLEPVMQKHSDKLHGILNGLDMDLFNPTNDVFIPQPYDHTSANTGKALCKQSLLTELGLPRTSGSPLFGMVSRFVEQKGLDILLEILPQCRALPAQFVFLGSGEHRYENALLEYNTRSRNIRAMIGFNLALGQHIYAGSDIFLMPSHFEPCGLSQMIALRYGTLPLVRKTGGLADTVFDLRTDKNKGNGFVFAPYTSEALLETITTAIEQWQTLGATWQQFVQRGMQTDFSWARSAKIYQDVYRDVCQQSLQRVS